MDTVSEITKIKILAKNHGLSMAAICKEAGLDRSTPIKWENGERKATLENLARLQNALDKLAGKITHKTRAANITEAQHDA